MKAKLFLNSSLGICVVSALTVQALADCFQYAQNRKISPSPPCSLGTQQPPDSKGYYCYRYTIKETGYGWWCYSCSDNEYKCDSVTTTVHYDEFAGSCNGVGSCGLPWTLIYADEPYTGSVVFQSTPCGG
jgi:hypothetical protein